MICASELELLAFSAYGAGMGLELSNRIKLLRKKLGKTQVEFADMLEVSQGTVSRWEKGSMPEPEHLMRLSELDGMSIEQFLGNNRIGPFSGEPIPVVGFVGAGAAVYPVDDLPQGGAYDTEERPPFVEGRAVAVEVRGDSLIPVAEDGWRLVYVGEQTIVEEDVLNRLCVVALTDGRILVKRILRGSEPQRYHLASTNAPMIENAEVLWAARVKAIIPK